MEHFTVNAMSLKLLKFTVTIAELNLNSFYLHNMQCNRLSLKSTKGTYFNMVFYFKLFLETKMRTLVNDTSCLRSIRASSYMM